jgi:sugar lactone lactonase YvrE
MDFASQMGSIAINSKGHIFVFQRAQVDPQLLEFDQNRKFVRAFGEGIAVRAHGMRFDAQDNMWICDQNGGVVMKLSPEGKILMTIGERGKQGDWDEAQGIRLLWQPLDVAIARNGDIYISMGHGMDSPAGHPARILRLDKNGKYINQWFGNIDGPGKFAMAHSIVLDPKGDLYIADRQDKHIVVYDDEGKFIRTIQMPNLVCTFMVTKNNELWISTGTDGQIEKLDWDGNVKGWTGLGPGKGPGQFGEANFMTMDSHGNILIVDSTRIEEMVSPKT